MHCVRRGDLREQYSGESLVAGEVREEAVPEEAEE